MAERMSLPNYPQFDCKSSEGRSVRWAKWVSRLKNNVFVAYQIDDDRRQTALLLTYAGDDFNDIVDSLPAESLTPGDGETHLGKLEEAVGNHFNLQANIEFQKYSFRHLSQKTDSIDDFYNDLKQVAATCGFGNRQNEEIKSQLITGCKSAKVREKGLSTPNISLPDLLQFARTLELTKAQSKKIETDTGSINNIHHKQISHNISRNTYQKGRRRSSTAPKTEHEAKTEHSKCNNCGRSWPHKGGQSSCPAFGSKCRKCEKMHHFEKVCMSDKAKYQGQKKKTADVRHMVTESSEDEYVFVARDKSRKLPHFDVTVNGLTVQALADSGASVNILPEEIYNKLLMKPDLSPSTTRIYSYGKQSVVPVIGVFKADLSSDTTQCQAPVYVVPGNEEFLLGWTTSQDLQLIAVVNTTHQNSLTEEYKDLFIGLGKLKNIKVKLHIDKEVQPVAQRYRRVPFHVRKNIEEQIKKDAELGVIEKATGATPWVSPLVVVPKPSSPGQVRVCNDMRAANQAIKRERHSTPTLDELTSLLAGAKVFSKLDLNQAYNQLELTEDSRYITTFATHLGLYRFKRLNFGINSAAEVFQETIRQALNGLKGVINSSDDILIYGHSQQDHDANLRALFQRLRERGLTLKASNPSTSSGLLYQINAWLCQYNIGNKQEVAHASLNDTTLKAVIHAIQSGKWYEAKIEAGDNLHTKTFNALEQCQYELSIVSVDNQHIVLKGSRIVLPASLHQRAIDLAHSGHQGIVKTLSLLREKIWFHGMRQAVENTVKGCFLCQVATPDTTREPLKMSPLPERPWSQLSADFGHVPNGEYILVITDEYSKFVIVDVLTSLSSSSVIPRFDKVFSEYGIPDVLKTDNGPPFNSYDFAKFAEYKGFKHRKITPLWPRANAETERFMRTIKKTIKGAVAQNLNWKQEMYKFLLAYRATPHTSIGIAPGTAMFNRNMRTLLPEYSTVTQNEEMKARDDLSKLKMREYADNKRNIVPSQLTTGDPVLVKNTDLSRSKTPYKPKPFVITAKKGSMITAKRGGKTVTRNSSFFKRSPRFPTYRETEENVNIDVNTNACPSAETEQPQQPTPPPQEQRPKYQRPQREHRLPQKYKDFVLS